MLYSFFLFYFILHEHFYDNGFNLNVHIANKTRNEANLSLCIQLAEAIENKQEDYQI